MNAHAVTRNQMWTDTSRGASAALGVCRSAPDYDSQGRSAAGRATFPDSAPDAAQVGLSSLVTTGGGFGSRLFQFGFVDSLNELADIVTLDRAGAYHGRRPRVLCPPDHLDRQKSSILRKTTLSSPLPSFR
jgi:hypothetical protein